MFIQRHYSIYPVSEEILLKQRQKHQLVWKKKQAAGCKGWSIAFRNGLILPPGAKSGCLFRSGGRALGCKKLISQLMKTCASNWHKGVGGGGEGVVWSAPALLESGWRAGLRRGRKMPPFSASVGVTPSSAEVQPSIHWLGGAGAAHDTGRGLLGPGD